MGENTGLFTPTYTSALCSTDTLPPCAEEAFADYHLYSMPGTDTLRDRENQTLTLLEPRDVQVKPRYVYRGGDPTRSIPSCTGCHGPNGLGNLTAGYPKLRGQHAAYTVKQLNEYGTEQRYVDVTTGAKTRSRNGHMMTSISQRLTDEDKAALANYIQGLR